MLAWFKKRKRTKQPDEAESVEDLTIQVPTTQKQAAKKKKEKVATQTEVCFDSWRSMQLWLLQFPANEVQMLTLNTDPCLISNVDRTGHRKDR